MRHFCCLILGVRWVRCTCRRCYSPGLDSLPTSGLHLTILEKDHVAVQRKRHSVLRLTLRNNRPRAEFDRLRHILASDVASVGVLVLGILLYVGAHRSSHPRPQTLFNTFQFEWQRSALLMQQIALLAIISFLSRLPAIVALLEHSAHRASIFCHFCRALSWQWVLIY